MDSRQTVEIRVRGTVQGVGFRPTVWRLARAEGLVGEVLNDGRGVLIRTTGTPDAVGRVLDRLRADPPPLARIEDVQTRQLAEVLEFDDFRIVASTAGENRTRVAPDAATCPACRAEVLDPADRRAGYPFANCTHCGPRFSIVTRVPYDRANTTMAAFPMCPACAAAEYADPADRRFHAQPVACPACGPAVWLEVPGEPDARGGAAVAAAVRLLLGGAVVAVRGLGGFHLACSATDPAAVARLRTRKRRDGKPFAVMAKDLDTVRRYCRVTPAEADLLLGPAAPVVLLAAAGPEVLPADVAPGLDTLGFMLPYTPLHLLLARAAGRPLVMTSGNVTHEPQVTDREAARARLGAVADAFLMHDREVANRIDDSVVRVVASRPQVIRRARGYAPAAVPLPPGFEAAPELLAYGGELKATFCLVTDGAAVLSQHQGDLEDAATFDDYQQNLDLYAAMYDHRPRALAADAHPEYLSSKLARRRAADDDLPLLDVQHHHAHVAACMAEHGLPLGTAPVLGVAFDGLGYGDDGTLWGGEFLLADYRGYWRLAAALAAVPMPGGAQAVREPWRNTYAHLAAGRRWARVADQYAALPLVRYLTTKPLAVIDRMIERGLNAPPASSCGRLCDAVAAALCLCADHALFEGQGAMELEAVAGRAGANEPGYPFAVAEAAGGLLRLDPSPMWDALLADLEREVSVPRMAARFHHGLAAAVGDTVARLRRGSTGGFDTVVLSGGCFQNRLLTEAVARRVGADGLRCLTHGAVPANDGGLALGQAVVAAARQLGPVVTRRSTACV